jgi:hypothetical protein
LCGRSGGGDDDVGVRAHCLVGQGAQTRIVLSPQPDLELEVLALHPAALTQRLPEYVQEPRRLLTGREHDNARDFPCLRMAGAWRREEAQASDADELAAIHY